VTVLIPKGKPSIEEIGITLIAVPSVGADMSTVSLLLMPTISELEGWSYYQDGGVTNTVSTVRPVTVKLPIISRKEVQTKVIVQSGETVALGGLIDTVKQHTVHKVPLLGSIPVLGRLFHRDDITEQRKNLLIFVTATVLSERGETLVPYWNP
jgi:type IV pilus assembly protein PilQ